ncbi:hypothetical protein [Rosistilla oblonga]|uniref:hypothetical protein n=1 Tax=Rosistilla oblonga TaxID=2527990 RepID=UPI003A979C3F
MDYQPSDGTWQVGGDARLLIELRQQMTADQYESNKQALKEFLCGYFSSGDCNRALGDSISPLKATAKGGKVLKVRWALPGSGKSGSLRLVVVAYCHEKRVHIAQAFNRRDNPSGDDFREAVDDY